MPLVSVPAVYDGTKVDLLETPPTDRPYRVLVTFIEPVKEDDEPPSSEARFWASFGAWQDDRPLDATLADIYAVRRSRAEPPPL
jgi:hypothetical protein